MANVAWYLEEMVAFFEHFKENPHDDIDMFMHDLVQEFRFMEFLKAEPKQTRSSAKKAGHTLNSEIRKYNDLVRISVEDLA